MVTSVSNAFCATHLRTLDAGPHNDAVETRAESDFGQEAGTTLEAGDEASAGAFSSSTKVGSYARLVCPWIRDVFLPCSAPAASLNACSVAGAHSSAAPKVPMHCMDCAVGR
jgi:hypothetical protein